MFCLEVQNSAAVALFRTNVVGEIQQKQGLLCLKCKSLNINFWFIELFYKISITFAIMLIFGEKNGTLHMIFSFR